MHTNLLRGNREISIASPPVVAGRLTGRLGAIAANEYDGEVGLARGSGEAGEQGGFGRCGVCGAKGRGQGECGSAKHGPDAARAAVSNAQTRIRDAVTRNRQGKLTALLHHISIDVLRASFFDLKKSAAPGVDEMTWADYVENIEANLANLHRRVHTGAYRALPSRRRTFRRRMADNGRSASPDWKTRSSSRRWLQS